MVSKGQRQGTDVRGRGGEVVLGLLYRISSFAFGAIRMANEFLSNRAASSYRCPMRAMIGCPTNSRSPSAPFGRQSTESVLNVTSATTIMPQLQPRRSCAVKIRVVARGAIYCRLFLCRYVLTKLEP